MLLLLLLVVVVVVVLLLLLLLVVAVLVLLVLVVPPLLVAAAVALRPPPKIGRAASVPLGFPTSWFVVCWRIDSAWADFGGCAVMVFVPSFDGTAVGRPLSRSSMHVTQGMSAAYETAHFGEQAVVHRPGGGSALRAMVDPDSEEGRLRKNSSMPDLRASDHLVFTKLPDRGKVALYPGMSQRIDFLGKRDVTRRKVRRHPFGSRRRASARLHALPVLKLKVDATLFAVCKGCHWRRCFGE